MTNIKKVLLAATALTMMSGAAWAQATGNGNEAHIEQGNSADDSGNSLVVDQADGTGNKAGAADPYNLRQDGDDNDMEIIQSGNNNEVGTRTATDFGGQTDDGVSQTGDDNVLSITQSSNNNNVDEATQASGSSPAFSNTLIIEQSGSSGGNRVSKVNQTISGSPSGGGNTVNILQSGNSNRVGAAGNFGIEQSGFLNEIDIDQTSNSNFVFEAVQQGENNSIGILQESGNRNSVRQISQRSTFGGGVSAGNSLTITQTGADNYVGNVSQTNNGGAINTASLTFNGDNNGTSAFTGDAAIGLTLGNVVQSGGGNTISYDVTGNNNSFAFTQTAAATGGFGNLISGEATGSDHQVAIRQFGNDNITTFGQTGNGNIAGVDITGDRNKLNLQQDQSGPQGNTISVSINGSDNNNFPTSPALRNMDGDFLNAVQDARAQLGGGSTSFVQGDLFQDGSNNSLDLDVIGNQNAFATFQDGRNNIIEGTITGASNVAVVAQIGNGNFADMSVTGTGNVLDVSQ